MNGDTVEIFTSKARDAGPSRDWLGIVKTPRARSKIRQWFSKERREDAIEAGRDALVRALRKAGLPLQKLTQSGALAVLATEMRFANLEALYASIGSNQTSAMSVVTRLQSYLGADEQDDEDESLVLARSVRPPSSAGGLNRGVVVKGAEDVWVKLARCCTPVPHDPIIGFVTRGHGVSVHRADCPNGAELRREPDRLLDVAWDMSGPATFAVTIEVEALDRTSCCAISPRCCPSTTSASSPRRWRPDATASPRCASRSSSPTSPTSRTCSPRSSASTGCSTPSASCPNPRQAERCGRSSRGWPARRVLVAGEVVGEVGAGVLVLVGVGKGDSVAEAEWLGSKVADLRIFDDERGLMNRSLADAGGAALVVSQFTLYGDARKGRRPSYIDAAPGDVAAPLVEAVAAALAARGLDVARGVSARTWSSSPPVTAP